MAKLTGLINRLAAAADVRAEPSQKAAFADLLLEAKGLRSRLSEQPSVTDPGDLAEIDRHGETLAKKATALDDFRATHGLDAVVPD